MVVRSRVKIEGSAVLRNLWQNAIMFYFLLKNNYLLIVVHQTRSDLFDVLSLLQPSFISVSLYYYSRKKANYNIS